jgi:hypothetical protein
VPSCKLCKHNPSRRCAVNFDKKYLVNDVLKAKCQAVIRVEIVERTTNQPIESSELREDMTLQMAILDGNTYDAKFEAGMEGDFEACILLMNNKVCPQDDPFLGSQHEPYAKCKHILHGMPCSQWFVQFANLSAKVALRFLANVRLRKFRLQGTPTLVGTAVSNDQHGFIRVPLLNSRLVLPDLRVTDSSEAMLSGRKPPLRLLMRAVYKDTLLPVPHIRHAISEGFVVAVGC